MNPLIYLNFLMSPRASQASPEMKYSLIESQELINVLCENYSTKLQVDITSNYRSYVSTLYFMNIDNNYYFKEHNNTYTYYYQVPSNITMNNILHQMYGDYDHYLAEHSDIPLHNIINDNNIIEVAIEEKGNILYHD